MATDLIKEIEKQIVKTDSLFSVDKSFDDERFMRVRIAAMHSGINRNNSSFSTDVIKAAKDTFANIPILADVQEYEDEDGNKYLDYSGHSMHIEDDYFDKENARVIYDEKVVGIVPESNNFEIVKDEETGNDYVYVDALLYREYGNYVCNILESRDNKTEVSMEIACNDVSYSAKEKCLVVNNMTATAITLLGAHVTPGMAKAHAEVFSMSVDDRQNQLIQIMQELKESLDNYTAVFTAKDNTKGGNNQVNKFEELLAKYEKTVEDITFEYEGLSDEELETAFAKAFEEEDAATDPEPTSDPEPTVDPEPVPDSEPSTDPESTPVDEELAVDSDDAASTVGVVMPKNVYSVEVNGVKREFAISLNDKQIALENLVNETYSEIDCDYYFADVYEEDSFVVMHSWGGKHFRQSFKCKKGVYSLVGDRIPVFAQYLTEDEIAKLDSMKSNYSSISEKLEKYETEPAKMEIINSNDYAQISESDDFKAFAERDAHFDMSVEDVKAHMDSMLLEYAKKGNLNFSANEHNTVNVKPFMATSKKESRYGNLFSK